MKKIIDYITTITSTIIFITIGIFFIVRSSFTFELTIQLIGIAILFSIIFKTINTCVKKHKITANIFDIIINLAISLLLITIPHTFTYLLTKIFGIYAFLQSLSAFINIYIYYTDKIKGNIYNIIYATITFTFAILLMFSPTKNEYYFCLLTGIYLIFYGLYNSIELAINTKNKIPLPVFFTMFLPQFLIRKIEKEHSVQKETIKPDLEILIHLAKKGSAGFGHVEIGYNNKVYSYACYNYHSRRLFGGIGDGIFGVFDHNSYIKFCINKRNRFILSYGMKLSENEKKIIEKRIDSFINNNTTRWIPDAELIEKKELPKRPLTDMSDEIYHYTKGKFYKIIKGQYKTFFVLRTNCNSVTDYILESLGTRLLPIEGIISPGTYYKYLDNEYKKKNSRIISKKIYSKELVKELKYKYKKKSN